LRFAAKVFFATIIVITTAMSIGGYLLIVNGFDMTLDREVTTALDENQLLRFSLQSSIIAQMSSEEPMNDEVLGVLMEELEDSSRSSDNYIKLFNSNYKGIYSNADLIYDDLDLMQALELGERKYQITKIEDITVIMVSAAMDAGDNNIVYLSTARNITPVFTQRDNQFKTFVLVDCIIVGISAIIMLYISFALTKPLRTLAFTTRRIAGGEYSRRSKITSKDEFGDFSQDFNSMAEAMEDKIHELEDVALQRQEFVANFAHELKTPLTSIIGYADMLRSKKLPEDIQFKASGYIFSEGKRLESLSLKLLELIVVGKQDFELRRTNMGLLLEDVEGVLLPLMYDNGIDFRCSFMTGIIMAEPDLLKTMIMNLADNARKASEKGSKIEIIGEVIGKKYLVKIRDYGRGIPKEELSKITEAFYMVDKSRSRAQHGAGLGLALCSTIADLHNSRLVFDSIVDKGTTVSFEMDIVPDNRRRISDDR